MTWGLRLSGAYLVLALTGCGGSAAEARPRGAETTPAGDEVSGAPAIDGDAGGSGAGDGGAGDGAPAIGGDAGTPPSLAPGRHSWDVTIHGLRRDDTAFTLAYQESASTFSALLAADGKMVPVTFDRSSQDGSLSLEAPSNWAPLSPYALRSIQVSTLTIQALDDDGDGVVDRLAGSGRARTETNTEAVQSSEGAFTFDAVPDVTAPQVVPDTLPVSLHSPLDTVHLALSEPLAQASLSLVGDPKLSLTGEPNDGALIRLSSALVLPFAQTWQLGGTGQDFSGNPLRLNGAWTTLDDPGVFAQDGFEGPVAGVFDADAIIDGTSGVAPPSGAHALLITPGASALFHLKRSGDAPVTLSFSFISLSNFPEASVGAFYVEAAVIGGTTRTSAPLHPVGKVALSNAQWAFASTPVTTTLQLTEKGPDIAVSFSISAPFCPYPGFGCPPPGPSVVIDDLKVLN